ncbi:hypothetical protein [Streptomyces sp. NPDC053079]|uniref:hypothetical protein n=1 Tax=Streptomyces sp. NPDC053079 TaxID=3365697 RepID=UPI0037D9181E
MVHPPVAKRQRMTSEWFYECREKFGIGDPEEDGTPEQAAEYNAEIDAIYARIRQEYAAEKAARTAPGKASPSSHVSWSSYRSLTANSPETSTA